MSYLDYDSRMLAALEAATGQSSEGAGPFQDYDSRIQALLAYLAAYQSQATVDTPDAVEDLDATTAPEVINTRGFDAAGDGGGATFLKVDEEPEALPTINFHRTQDFNGNWYEAVMNNVVKGEQAGIYGDPGTDVGAHITDVATWLTRKGGGRLDLPEGIISCVTAPVIDGSGIWLRGKMVGDSGNDFGTIFRGGKVAAGAKCIIGSTGVVREEVRISDMKVIKVGANDWSFLAMGVRGLVFDNISYNGLNGFLYSGQTDGVDGATDDNYVYDLWLSRIRGSMASTALGFLQLQHTGNVFATQCHIEGNDNWTRGSGIFGVKIPVGGYRTDGGVFTGFNLHYFDIGYDLCGGGGNFVIGDAFLDGMFTHAFKMAAETPLQGVYVNNLHMTSQLIGAGGGETGHSDVAVTMSTSGSGDIERVHFTNCAIFHWGRGAFDIQAGDRIKITGNTLLDCTIDADNTYDVITLGASAGRGIDISDNTIDIEDQTNNPRYGVNIASTNADLRVENNTILNCQTGTILNSNRGDARTRKIQGNSGQVYEGQVVTFGPYSIINAAQNVSAGNMLLSANSSLIAEMAPARGRIMQWYIGTSPVNTVSAGTVTCRPIVNGSAVAPASSAIDSDSDFGSGTDAGGVEFSVGDRIGMTYTTSADFAPTGSQELVGRVVVVFD